MKISHVPFLFAAFVMLACQRQVDISIAGNGGNPLGVLVKQGVQHAIGVVERLRVDETDSPDLVQISRRRESIINDLRTSEYRVVEKAPVECKKNTDCFCSSPTPPYIVYVIPQKCVGVLKNKYDAAALALHETFHHLDGESCSNADSLSAQILDRWQEQGHSNSPHTLNLNDDTFFPNATYNGRHIVSWDNSWGEVRMRFLDPRTPDAAKERISEGGEVLKQGNGTPLLGDATLWMNGSLVAFPACNDRVLRYSLENNRWDVASTSPLSLRQDASYFQNGDQVIVWGGQACGSQQRLSDGAIWNPRSNAWSDIPPPAGPNRSISSAVWHTGRLYVWGREADSISAPASRTGVFTDPATDFLMFGLIRMIPHIQIRSVAGRVFDPALGRWDTIDLSNMGRTTGDFSLLALPDSILVLANSVSARGVLGRELRRYYPSENRWGSPVRIPDHIRIPGNAHMLWTGSEVIFVGSSPTSNARDLVLWNPTTTRWVVAPGQSPVLSATLPRNALSVFTGMEQTLIVRSQGFFFYP